LEGFRTEGRRNRYVRADLRGDVAESDRPLVSIKSAARQLGVSTVTLHIWIGKGRLESFRVEDERRMYVDAG
jgi:transposase-like protein